MPVVRDVPTDMKNANAYVLPVRLTVQERESVTAAARAASMSTHAYMRIAVLSLAGVSELPEQLRGREKSLSDALCCNETVSAPSGSVSATRARLEQYEPSRKGD